MPERPDLEYVVPILDRELTDRAITAVAVRKPVVLRLGVAHRKLLRLVAS